MALSVLPKEEYVLGEDASIEQRIRWDLERLRAGGKENFLPVINELEVHAFVEEEFEFNGETFTIPIHFAGSIDRGYATEDGTYALMELKTGKWTQTKNRQDEWQDSKFKLGAMRQEMAFYKHLLEIANHPYQDVSHWGWVYPSGDTAVLEPLNKYGYEQRSINKITYEPATGRRWTTYRKRVDKLKKALITAYLSDNFPTDASSGKCAWCDFKPICPAWNGSDDPQEYRDSYTEDSE